VTSTNCSPTHVNELHEVILVSIPDHKEALYVDGQLVIEASWVSQNKLLEKLIEHCVVRGGRRYADESALNDVGQFPRQLSTIAIRERKYP
jgi:hypothetical protein